MIYESIHKFIESRIQEFDQIPAARKEILEKIAAYIRNKHTENKRAELVYICIHNSRRSHFGQVAGDLASAYYGIDNVACYSGGTIATAFNPNAIAALREIGFRIAAQDSSENPRYQVSFQENQSTLCFSKIFDDPTNPQKAFAAIMTCSEAEQNCPFIAAAELKLVTSYEDPSSSDGSGKESEVYTERFAQILRENLYLFSKVKQA